MLSQTKISYTMKRLTTLLLATATLCVASAQQPYKAFCTLATSHGYSIISERVEIDYGQEHSKREYLVDEQGREIEFNSIVDAANYISALGWHFEEAYTRGEETTRNVWVFSKEVTSKEQIGEGLLTRKQYEMLTKRR